MAKPNRTPNDQRSDAHNKNSPEYKSNMDHHAQQMNPGSAANKAVNDNRSVQMNPSAPGYQKPKSKQ